jgi:putative transposase
MLMTERTKGVTRACALVGISRSLFQYESRGKVADEELTCRRPVIAAQKRRHSYRRIYTLLRREGWPANHKRIWRLYRNAGLSVSKHRRKHIVAADRKPLAVSTGPNRSWRMVGAFAV